MEIDKKALGRKIKALRFELGMSQQQFAKKLKVATTAVHKWETGFNIPRIHKLKAIADLASLTVHDLLFGDEDLINESRRRGVDRD